MTTKKKYEDVEKIYAILIREAKDHKELPCASASFGARGRQLGLPPEVALLPKAALCEHRSPSFRVPGILIVLHFFSEGLPCAHSVYFVSPPAGLRGIDHNMN